MRSFKTYIKEQEEDFHVKEIEELISSVGGGNKSAGVFESWVHIVTTLSSSRTLPTVAEVNTVKKHPEFHSEGKAWLDKIGFPKGNDTYKFDTDDDGKLLDPKSPLGTKVLEAIEFI